MAARPPAKKRSLYDILGVPRDAMAIDIGMAYKKRLAEFDTQPGADPNEIALVREAYHILCQPRERESYDASLAHARGTRGSEDAPGARPHARARGAARRRRTPPWMWIAAAWRARPRRDRRGGMRRRRSAQGSPNGEGRAGRRSREDARRRPRPRRRPRTRSAQDVFTLAMPAVARIVAYDVSGTRRSHRQRHRRRARLRS